MSTRRAALAASQFSSWARPTPTMCANAAARSRVTSKSSPTMPLHDGVDERHHLVGPGRVDDAGEHLVHGCVRLAGRELPGRLLRLAVDPGAQQVEAPQRAGDRVGCGVRPQVGDHAEALLVGEVQHAGDQVRRPRRRADRGRAGGRCGGRRRRARPGRRPRPGPRRSAGPAWPAGGSRSPSPRSLAHGDTVVRAWSTSAFHVAWRCLASSDSGCGQRCGRELDLPRTRAAGREHVADGRRQRLASGGSQARARTSCGLRRFSVGRSCSSASAVTASRLRPSRSAASGNLSAQARGGGGPSRRGDVRGSSASGSRERPLDGVVPLARRTVAGRGCA